MITIIHKNGNLSQQEIQIILGKALSKGGEFAEIFLECNEEHSLTTVDKKNKGVCIEESNGASIRVFANECEFVEVTTEVTFQGLWNCARRLSENIFIFTSLYPKNQTIAFGKKENKKHFLEESNIRLQCEESHKLIDLAARSESKFSIAQVEISTVKSRQNILVANSQGVFAMDERHREKMIVTVTAMNDADIQKYNYIVGATGNKRKEHMWNPQKVGRVAAQNALELLSSVNCPIGNMPVVIAKGMGGTLIHEAVGHMLEAEYVANEMSNLSGEIGNKIASELVTIVDDATLEGEWGSQKIDDEGRLSEKTVLIDRGVLRSYLIDYKNSLKMGKRPTSNARRENYAVTPTSRMTNTILLPGKSSEDDIIKSVENGIFAMEFSGGSADPITGNFCFGITRGCIIRNGELKELIRGALITGNTREVLPNIDYVSNNSECGICTCGGKSGEIPVGMIQPMIRIKNLCVGGRE